MCHYLQFLKKFNLLSESILVDDRDIHIFPESIYNLYSIYNIYTEFFDNDFFTIKNICYFHIEQIS